MLRQRLTLDAIQGTLTMHLVAVGIPMGISWEADNLPLTKLIIGPSSKVHNKLPIPAGTSVVVSAFGYSQHVTCHPSSLTRPSLRLQPRNLDLWGPSDTYGFRPKRWLSINEKPVSPVGMYSNLYG